MSNNVKVTVDIDFNRILAGLKRKCTECNEEGKAISYELEDYLTKKGKTRSRTVTKLVPCKCCGAKGWYTEPEAQDWVNFFTAIRTFVDEPDKVKVQFIDEGYY